MNLLLRVSKLFLFILIMIFFIFILTYSIFIFKPDLALNTSNKLGLTDYKINFEEIDSNKNLLKPTYSVKNIEVYDKNSNVLMIIESLKIGINVLRSLSSDLIVINELEIVNFTNQIDSKSDGFFLTNVNIEINDLLIKSNDLNLNVSKSYISMKIDDISVVSHEGSINESYFDKLELFLPNPSQKLFFLGTFYLNEKDIINRNLINLDSFDSAKINLIVESNGTLDLENLTIESFNKYNFYESRLETESKFLINAINLELFEGDDENLYGKFEANIPDQFIQGSMYVSDGVIIKTNLEIDLSQTINDQRYFGIKGKEAFKTTIEIKDNVASLLLESDLTNTEFSSEIDEISKNIKDKLFTTIKIRNLSNPSYLIKNKKFEAFFDNKNNGYFDFGNGFSEETVSSKQELDGFYIYLNLKDINIENLLVDSSGNNTSNLRSIFVKSKRLNLFNNSYNNQTLKILFNENETYANFYGKNLNGSIRIDNSGFTRIDVFDTKFEFNGVSLANTDISLNDNINIRFVGRNIQTYDDVFQDVDFYFLRNKEITTIDNINIRSKNFYIGPYAKKKAYISFNRNEDLYKVRGSYEIDTDNFPFKDSINYDFGYLSSDLNIQWNSLSELKNLEGEVKFLIKDLESKASLPDSAFLRALRIFNLNAIVEGINSDSLLGSRNLIIKRAEGDFYVGQNRALINKPIKLETAEAKMEWMGEVLKDNVGILNELNLDLEMRLKLSENIPWYAAVFGGIPALAGGFIFENIIDERLDDASTFQFKVTGNINDPKIERLN